MMYYTYLHRRRDTNAVFYIGKGSGRRAWSRHGRNVWWCRIADKHGFDSELLAHWPTEHEAYSHECLLIDCFRDLESELVNMTAGGDGVRDLDPAIRARVGQINSVLLKGRRRDPESVAKGVAARRGYSASEDTRNKSRISNLRPESRLANAKGKTGVPKSEETKQRMRKPKARISCPHCELEGGISQMKRWHFDNCKYKI